MAIKWLVIPAAVLGGLLLNYMKVPAGALVGSMLGTAIVQIVFGTKLQVASRIKRAVRVIMGCYIGLGITLEGLVQLKGIPLVVGIVTLGMTIVSLLVAYILHKVYDWELAAALLGSLPAGLSEIGMNAEDYHVNPVMVTTIHLMRLITMITVIPLILKLLI